MGTLYRDLRHGIRMLLNRPEFNATAVIVLALGIGANTAVFSLVNAFLLKPLTIQKPEELVGCYRRHTQRPDDYRAFSYPNYVDLQDGNAVFSSLLAHNLAMVGVCGGETPRDARSPTSCPRTISLPSEFPSSADGRSLSMRNVRAAAVQWSSSATGFGTRPAAIRTCWAKPCASTYEF